VRLVWVRGEGTQGCDDRGAIARRVVERLGREVFSESASRSIEGVVQHEGDRWDAHLYVREADGSLFSRHLTSTAPDCTALDAAVTLAIALVIDPDAAVRTARATASTPPALSEPRAPPAAPSSAATERPASAPSSPTAAPPEPPPPILHARPNRGASPPPKPPDPSRRDSLAVTARALVAAGVLPGAAPGAAMSAEGPVERTFQATAGMLYLPEVRTASRDFAFGLTAGWLGVCAKPWAEGRVAIALCGKFLLGAIHSVVYTLEPTGPGDRLWTGASLSLGARFRIAGPVVAELGGEGLVPFPFTRYQFQVTGHDGSVFHEQSVAWFAFAGVGVSIP
jgi:hypothetical protein